LRITVIQAEQPVILVIDDDALIGRALKRLAGQAFPEYRAIWANNGVRALQLAKQYAAHLRLVILDVQLPLLSGHLIAAQLRVMLPRVPVMPFTGYEAMLPVLLELGCVQPVIKHPHVIAELPGRMRQALAAEVPPLPTGAWVAALQQSGETVLAFVGDPAFGAINAPESSAQAQVQKAHDLLAKYCARFPQPAREIILARKALAESIGP